MIEEHRGILEAESTLEALGFDTLPINLKEFASVISDDSFELVLESHPFESEKTLGKAIGNDRGAFIYVNSNIPDKGRYNFTVAHELGHVCMHIMTGQNISFECGENEIYNPYDDPIEKEANGFASGLLMPKHLIKPLTDGDINWVNIQSIKERCQTSLEASFRRMIKIYSDPTALIIHERGVFKRFIASSNFAPFINKSQLSNDQKSLCINVLDESLPNDFDIVDAIDWVNPEIKGETLQSIHSSTIALNNNITYTLLRYDDECFKGYD